MEEPNLLHEDLLIKLRACLNEEKIKLWEPPYIAPEHSVNQSLKELAARYSTTLATDADTVLNALQELQSHSLDRSKANAEFKETDVPEPWLMDWFMRMEERNLAHQESVAWSLESIAASMLRIEGFVAELCNRNTRHLS